MISIYITYLLLLQRCRVLSALHRQLGTWTEELCWVELVVIPNHPFHFFMTQHLVTSSLSYSPLTVIVIFIYVDFICWSALITLRTWIRSFVHYITGKPFSTFSKTTTEVQKVKSKSSGGQAKTQTTFVTRTTTSTWRQGLLKSKNVLLVFVLFGSTAMRIAHSEVAWLPFTARFETFPPTI